MRQSEFATKSTYLYNSFMEVWETSFHNFCEQFVCTETGNFDSWKFWGGLHRMSAEYLWTWKQADIPRLKQRQVITRKRPHNHERTTNEKSIPRRNWWAISPHSPERTFSRFIFRWSLSHNFSLKPSINAARRASSWLGLSLIIPNTISNWSLVLVTEYKRWVLFFAVTNGRRINWIWQQTSPTFQSEKKICCLYLSDHRFFYSCTVKYCIDFDIFVLHSCCHNLIFIFLNCHIRVPIFQTTNIENPCSGWWFWLFIVCRTTVHKWWTRLTNTPYVDRMYLSNDQEHGSVHMGRRIRLNIYDKELNQWNVKKKNLMQNWFPFIETGPTFHLWRAKKLIWKWHLQAISTDLTKSKILLDAGYGSVQ